MHKLQSENMNKSFSFFKISRFRIRSSW